MTVPSGYLPSDEGVNHLQNMILAIANLQEKQRQNAVLASYRDAERLKAEQATADAQAKDRETKFQQGAAALFGQKYDAAMEPALIDVRNVLASGGSITAPVAGGVPSVAKSPTSGESDQVRMPNLVNRPATMSDLPTLARPGVERVRQDFLDKLESMGVSKDSPQYQYYLKSPSVVLPTQAATELKDTSVASQERTKTEITSRTQEDEIKRLRAVASKAVTDARVGEVEARTKEATLPYIEQTAYNEAQIKDYERQIKRGDVEMIPAKKQELDENIKRLKNENIRLQNEAWKFNKTNELTAAYYAEKDPAKREQYLRGISLIHGHSGEVMQNDLAKQNAYINAVNEAAKLDLTAVKYLKDYPDAAAQAGAAANQQRIAAAKIAGSPTTVITSVSQAPNWHSIFGVGKPTATYGSAVMPTERADELYSGKLAAIAKGNITEPTGKTRTLPDGRVVPEVRNRAEALAWYVYGSNPAYSTDPAALAHFIGQFPTDQATKDQALTFVNDIVLKNKEAPPAAPGTPGAQLKPVGAELPTAVGTTTPAKVGTSSGATTTADIEAKDAEAAAVRQRRLSVERDRALYVAKKAQEAGVTAMQATPAQIKKWQDEFDRDALLKARAGVAASGQEVADKNAAMLRARGQ